MAATASLKSSLLLPSPISDFSGAAVSVSAQVKPINRTGMPWLINERDGCDEPDMVEGWEIFSGRRGGSHGSRGARGCKSRRLRTPRTFSSWAELGSLVSSCPGSLSRRAIRLAVPFLSSDLQAKGAKQYYSQLKKSF